MNRLLLLLGWLLLPLAGRANHVIGGDISLQHLTARPGYYRIQLTQYWETANLSSGTAGNTNIDPTTTVYVFRKKNPVLVGSYEISLRSQTPLVYNNAACATQRNLITTKAIYSADYQFDPKLYADPDGYYLVWERCCRNDAMVNMADPVALGMMLYMEFPALSKNGAPTPDSSPVFSNPNGDYVCLNKPFSYDFSATDADGDQLRYSLVTPYQGYTTRNDVYGSSAVRTNYPTVVWRSGFGAQVAIPGNPALQIDPVSGRLTVRANRTGIFLFSVQVDEYRNGVRIGQTRRDFQLPVIDCPNDRPAPAVIKLDTTAVTVVRWCQNTTPPTLNVEARADWAYQWQKDGVNLPGATSPTFTISEPGNYVVAKTFANRCADDTLSAVVRVESVAAPTVRLTTTGPQPACTGDTVLLTAGLLPAGRYRWQRNGQGLPGSTTAQLRAGQSGLYAVQVRLPGYTCDAQDTARVTINPFPLATLRADKNPFCPGDSALLTVPAATGQRYAWQRNGAVLPGLTNSATARVRQDGTYRVTVTGAGGCTAVSAPVSLSSNPLPIMLLDSVPPRCPSGPGVPLRGSPVGGQYAGPGVQAGQFRPAVAGAGRHRLSYSITTPDGCRAEAVRWAEVWAGPGLRVPPTYIVARNNSVQLVATATQPAVQFRWEPPQYLDQPETATPIARPPDSITYRVTATNGNGCIDTATVAVEVYVPLYIPTAFSPNGDGVNDVWQIRNVAYFPEGEVTVYNRWGSVVFFSVGYAQPWDGRLGSDRIEAGIYLHHQN